MEISSKRFLILIIMALLIATACFAKRGGSGGMKKIRAIKSSSSPYTMVWIGCGIVFVIFVIIYSVNNKQKIIRKVKIYKKFKQYEAKSKEHPSTLNEKQKGDLINQFIKSKYTIAASVNGSERFFCEVKVVNFKKQNQSKYIIELQGSDSIGSSKFDGVLIFRADAIGLKLSKVYNDTNKAGQTGNRDILLYQGFGYPYQISGQYSQIGLKNSQEACGSWSMYQK